MNQQRPRSTRSRSGSGISNTRAPNRPRSTPHTDNELKQQAIDRTAPTGTPRGRYEPPDQLGAVPRTHIATPIDPQRLLRRDAGSPYTPTTPPSAVKVGLRPALRRAPDGAPLTAACGAVGWACPQPAPQGLQLGTGTATSSPRALIVSDLLQITREFAKKPLSASSDNGLAGGAGCGPLKRAAPPPQTRQHRASPPGAGEQRHPPAPPPPRVRRRSSA